MTPTILAMVAVALIVIKAITRWPVPLWLPGVLLAIAVLWRLYDMGA